MVWLQKIPLIPLVLIAVAMGMAPVMPEPHLVEKLRMLARGDLAQPIDIFDLVLHGAPSLLLLAKLAQLRSTRKT